MKQRILGTIAYLMAILLLSTGTVRFMDPSSVSGISAAVSSNGYHFDFEEAQKGPYLNAKSVLLVNYENGKVVYGKNAEVVRPIASITKLMTAMVIIDNGISLDSTATITKEDARRSSKSRLRVGTKMSLRDLMHAMLMSSDNRAARAAARATCGSIEAFAEQMNRKARSLGLRQTRFVEPTGLSKENVSTAVEVGKLTHYAYDYDLISSICSKKRHVTTMLNRKRYRSLPIGNTNRMVWSPYTVLAGKTGYIQASDYCLATIVENKQGQRLTSIVLGVPGDKLRFKESRRLLNWGFRNIT